MQLTNADAPDDERRKLVVITGAIAGLGTLATAIPLVSSFAPSERARALGASVEVDISDLAPGAVKTVEWRGKPVWILRRTAEMVAGLAVLEDRLVDPHSLRDQQPENARNLHRSIKEEILVTVGVCTHLGCSPNLVPSGTLNPSVGEDWAGGFFCPCHGSTFDLAGRVFKNKPAPTNLEVPPHNYLSDSKLLIGEDNLT